MIFQTFQLHDCILCACILILFSYICGYILKYVSTPKVEDQIMEYIIVASPNKKTTNLWNIILYLPQLAYWSLHL